ncbi:hypothetical protein K432DRAFT_423299 [Lepidopterella palustris CBS 459.81]|uniref:FAS1 domain-containing protein n=1 Tax=Lepidopterella palustris CBS 459.81 TaxID=1314670 RepID=A0A8E2JIB8_9PEZI|nr:hypothetical protein K432DRAFT_423299 [Lepidopterella palustris CBS 459.81]
MTMHARNKAVPIFSLCTWFTTFGLFSHSIVNHPENTTFVSYLASSNSSLDSTATTTVFVPNNAALLSPLRSNQSLSAAELGRLIGAHVIEGYAAYSPISTSGAVFMSSMGPDITISTSLDGIILVNGDAKIVPVGILIANSVIHVIDKLLFTPPSLTTPPPSAPLAVFIVAAG